MELIIHQRPDISYVALVGRFDAGGVEEMEIPFNEATTARGLSAVVDVSGISFMSSLGIGFLFATSKKLKKAGGKLVLLNPQGMVAAVLKTSKMDKVMPLFYDLQEAVRAVGGDPTISTAMSAAGPAVVRRGERALEPGHVGGGVAPHLVQVALHGLEAGPQRRKP